MIGAPQYPFRDIEGGAVRVNIHQLGSEICIGRGCRDVQDQRYGPGHLHILIQGRGCVHQHVPPGLNVVLTHDACGFADHGSASRRHWMQRVVCIGIGWFVCGWRKSIQRPIASGAVRCSSAAQEIRDTLCSGQWPFLLGSPFVLPHHKESDRGMGRWWRCRQP